MTCNCGDCRVCLEVELKILTEIHDLNVEIQRKQKKLEKIQKDSIFDLSETEWIDYLKMRGVEGMSAIGPKEFAVTWLSVRELKLLAKSLR